MRDRDSSDEEAIRYVVRQINELWLSKKYDEIRALLSEYVVIASPGFDRRVRGRDAYIQSYRDYDLAATTHEFSPGHPTIDIADNVAVAVCPFFVVYELEGKMYRESGRDILVLSRTAGGWRVSWRTMQSEPVQESAG